LNRSVNDRLARAQDEIADLGREVLEVHQRMELILRLLESGAPSEVPAPIVLEERLAHVEARLRRLESTAAGNEAGHTSAFRAAAGRARRLLRSALKRAARRAFRTVKALRGSTLPPAEWIFETRIVRRDAVPSPALTIIVEGGAEEEALARDWLAAQTLRDVELVVRAPGARPESGERARLRGKWVCVKPPGPPDVPRTFLEEHLWAAASEDLAFTASSEGPTASLVLIRRDLLEGGSREVRLPSPHGHGAESCVIGRSLGSYAEVVWPGIARRYAPPPGTVCVGGLWMRRGKYISGISLERHLTPLDGLFSSPPGDDSVPATIGGPLVVLVASQTGYAGAVFAARLAGLLAPQQEVVLVDTDERGPTEDPMTAPGGPATYSVGSLLPPVLMLSAVEQVVRSRSAAAVLDLRWQADPLSLAQALRLRNRGLEVVRGPFEASDGPAFPPCLPPPGGVARPPEPARKAARECLGIPEGSLAVVLADSLDEDSGVFEFLQAAGSLEGQGGWFFVVAGGGPLRPLVRRLAAARGLAAFCIAGSGVPPADAIAAADVFCLPGAGPFRSHLLLQALAMGIPSVAGTSSAAALGAAEAVIDAGAPVNAGTLAAALATFASPYAREELSARGLSAAQAFIDGAKPLERWREWAGRQARRRR
jgi:Glycosyl transferases group 1